MSKPVDTFSNAVTSAVHLGSYIPDKKASISKYSEEELKFLERCLIEQHKASTEVFKFDPNSLDPVELIH